MNRRLVARLLILATLAALAWFVRQRQQAPDGPPPSKPSSTQTTPRGQGAGSAAQQGVPDYALQVLRHIRANGEAPAGHVGGREFQNREKRLPQKTAEGTRIRYSEWDVHPKVQGQNRGPERLVTGSDHSAWYTKDHYKSFLKIE